jgi:hypothetical protein
VNKPDDIVLACCNDGGTPKLVVLAAHGIDPAKDELGVALEVICKVEPPFMYFDREDVAHNPAWAAIARPLCQLLPRPLPDDEMPRWGEKLKAVVAVPWLTVVANHPGDLMTTLIGKVTNRPGGLVEVEHRPIGLVGDVVLVEVTGKVKN